MSNTSTRARLKPSRKDGRSRAIILSKRSNVFYLEHTKVFQSGERVVYQTDSGEDVEKIFNIPDKNTIFILLGQGTSITNSAIRKLAESNICIGFTGTGGSPLTAIGDFTFLLPQNEYRPTEYMQAWIKLWIDEKKRLQAAKALLNKRREITESSWSKLGIHIPDEHLETFEKKIKNSEENNELLLAEAIWAKGLYAILTKHYKIKSFSREQGKRSHAEKNDEINNLLDHGNYLAYGFSASALHCLGISFALPLLHGKTRRGGAVFDIADLYKDSAIMPLAFEYGTKAKKEQEFRAAILEYWHSNEILDRMIEDIKTLSISPDIKCHTGS